MIISKEEGRSSVDTIIEKLSEQLKNGTLNPGDRLPSERKLAELFGVGRTHVRTALQKLEFYGIVKTFPQSGSYIASLDVSVLESMMSDMLVMGEEDFFSLVEMRVILESNSARLAAERRTEEDLELIGAALKKYIEVYDAGGVGTEEDLAFHRAISNASKNPVLKSMQLLISPSIVRYYANNNVCSRREHTRLSHEMIFENIKNQNATMAYELMRMHLQEVVEFAEHLKDNGHKILK